MNKLLFLSCTFLLLFSCNSNDKSASVNKNTTLPQTLESFADSLVRLDKFTLESIDVAAGYYQRLVPADTVLADSAAVMFLRYVGTVVDTVNQKLYQDSVDYSVLIYEQSNNATQKQKQFQQYLLSHHVLLQGDGEGGVYAVPDYQWINQQLQPKTSTVTDNYLTLLGKEEKDPTLLDAGLAVETKELADRLIATETLLKQNLPYGFSKDVVQKNKFYTGTLLFGSDNSPALEYNDIILVEEYRMGYDYLLATYPNSAAAQLIKQWQSIVKTNDSKKIEEWRTKYNPYE